MVVSLMILFVLQPEPLMSLFVLQPEPLMKLSWIHHHPGKYQNVMPSQHDYVLVLDVNHFLNHGY